MKRLTLVLSVLFFASSAFGQQWDKYIPEKQQKETIKKYAKITGLGAALTGQDAWVFWLNESFARALVSRTIDRERITGKAATEIYNALRLKDSYIVLINVRQLYVARVKAISPLSENEIFLQREGDKKQFSKGKATNDTFGINLNGLLTGPAFTSSYFVLFPKSNLIRSLDEKLELQFYIGGKKVVMKYKAKDLGTKLEDL